MSTIIISCHCENSYQDEKYGFHKRVHNLTTLPKISEGQQTKGGRPVKARCTICSNVKEVKN
jgi:hypothetical protein